jgi:hypothetical protein
VDPTELQDCTNCVNSVNQTDGIIISNLEQTCATSSSAASSLSIGATGTSNPAGSATTNFATATSKSTTASPTTTLAQSTTSRSFAQRNFHDLSWPFIHFFSAIVAALIGGI